MISVWKQALNLRLACFIRWRKYHARQTHHSARYLKACINFISILHTPLTCLGDSEGTGIRDFVATVLINVFFFYFQSGCRSVSICMRIFELLESFWKLEGPVPDIQRTGPLFIIVLDIIITFSPSTGEQLSKSFIVKAILKLIMIIKR